MKDYPTLNVPEPAKARPSKGASGRGRILVVDDDQDVLRLNTETLSGHGYEVDSASDGAMAWEKLELNRYDLLVTDNSMPKVTGLDLIKKVRATHMSLPIIMASGHPPEDFYHPSLKPAVALLKPYTLGDLLGTVENVLRLNAPDPEPIELSNWKKRQAPEGWLL